MADVLYTIEQRILSRLITLGRARCSAGFGNYPVGVREAIDEVLKLSAGVDMSAVLDGANQTLAERLADFDARLAR